MKMFLVALLAVMAVFVILCFVTVKSRKDNVELKRWILALLSCGIISIVIYFFVILSKTYESALIFINLYMAMLIWIMVVMLKYTSEYTGVLKNTGMARKVALVLYVADSCNIILNIFFKHAFDIIQVEWNGELFYDICSFKVPFFLHLALIGALECIILYMYVKKINSVPKFYKSKYAMVLVSFIVILMANIISTFNSFPVDSSIFLYGIASVAICYFSLIFIPKGLEKKTLSYLVAEMSDVVCVFDLWGKCVYQNETAKKILKDEKFASLTYDYFSNWIENRKDKSLKEECWDDVFDYDGISVYFECRYNKIIDDNNEEIGFFFVMHDRTEEVEEFKRRHYRMAHDELTGLYRREYFYQNVEIALRDNSEKDYYLVCSDITEFKIFNELFGQERGNEVLMRIAGGISHNYKKDVYGRISGDAFAWLVPAERYNENQLIQFIKEIENEFSSNLYKMRIAVGVYKIQDYSEPAYVMCDKCRMAIDSITNEYSRSVIYYDEKILEKSHNEKRIVGEFEEALESGMFKMYLQPQATKDGKVIGAEALVRWEHPDKGIIAPNEFIPIFENTGLIWKLDYYIWEQAAIKLKEWEDKGKKDWYISVNISPDDMYHVDIYSAFTGFVETYGIDPKMLKLEITETVFIKEKEAHKILINRLRDYGFEVEMDDFGSGYSSLNMLKEIKVDVLKLDMGFLQLDEKDDETGKRSWDIINMIIGLAKVLELKIVTEGVETQEQVTKLSEMGCNIFQGYYFSKPLRIEEFESKYDL